MKKFTLLFLLFLPHFCLAQNSFPKKYFANPLKIPMHLAGGFAECRPNHFHTGIDIKTNNKENLPVMAAADGYISRISISHTGYGNCLYMNHPNGYTTVYGHLNHFAPALMRYLKKEQYRQQSWNIDIAIPPDLFNFKQGDIIAYSGNTGGSTAPHLHFEIRDTKTQTVYNALFFGMPIVDNIPPVATQAAFYDADNYYESTPTYIPLKKLSKSSFALSQNIVTLSAPRIMVGIDAKDYMNNSNNWLGITSLELWDNEALITHIEINSIDFSQNRAVNAYGDYRTFKQKGNWIHGLYRLKNNPLEVYTSVANNGIIDISDAAVHDIKIIMRDALGNTSTISGKLKWNQKSSNPPSCNQKIFSGKMFNFYNNTNNLFLKMPADVLYTDVCLSIRESKSPSALSDVFDILSPYIPAHGSYELGLKINKILPLHLRSKLVFVHKVSKASLPGIHAQDAQAISFQKGYGIGKVNTFGNYYIAVDTIKPTIKHLKTVQENILQFQIKDNLTSIKKMNGYINDQWVCFSRKGNVFTYVFEEHCPRQKNTLRIEASDQNNNIAQYTMQFTRK